MPSHLKGNPPFGQRTVFRKSLGTKDRREALRLKDQFLRSIGFEDADQTIAERIKEEATTPADQYYRHLNTIDVSGGIAGLQNLADELRGQLRDIAEEGATAGSGRRARTLKAQLEATNRTIDELTSSPAVMSEKRHTYELTLANAVERYKLEQIAKKLRAKTVAKLITANARYTEFAGKSPELRSIRRATVTAYIRAMKDNGLSKATVQNDLGFLGGAFEHAQNEGSLDDSIRNPFRGHSLSGFTKAESRKTYTQDQIALLLKQAGDDRDLAAAIYIGYYTGMRLSEVFTARIAIVDKVLCWSVAEDGGKTDAATRLIPLSTHLKVALKHLNMMPAEGDAVKWATSSDQALGKRFGRLKTIVLPVVGIEDHAPYTFHSLRHGFVTILMSAGFSELEVADLSGHAKSGFAKTEAGRTYFGQQHLKKLVSMVDAVPPV